MTSGERDICTIQEDLQSCAHSPPTGAEWFTSPQQVNQRRYEALRAYFTEGLTYEQAGARFGYTRWAMINLARDYRAGKLELFAPPRKPGATVRSGDESRSFSRTDGGSSAATARLRRRVSGTGLELARGDGGDRNPGDLVGGRGFRRLPDGAIGVFERDPGAGAERHRSF